MRKTRAKQISGHPINASTLCTCVHADAWELLRCARASCTGAALPGLLSKIIIHLHAPALLGRLLHRAPSCPDCRVELGLSPKCIFYIPARPGPSRLLTANTLNANFPAKRSEGRGFETGIRKPKSSDQQPVFYSHSRLFGPGTRVLSGSGTSVRAQAPYAHGSGTRVRLWT